MDDLWQITLIGDKASLAEIELELEEALDPPLSLSLFEHDLPAWKLAITVNGEPEADWLKTLSQPPGVEVEASQLPAKNWVLESLRFLTPVTAGRFHVHGSHDEPEPDAVSICIPAGMAFGTGHHETTSGCLLEFDQMLNDSETFDRVIDLGTGAGILAIAAAKTLPASIVATDIDPVAIEVGQQNANANEVASRINWIVADGVDDAAISSAGFDLVFANILAGPLIEMASGISALLAPKGRLILAGLLNEQAHQVQAAYLENGLDFIRSRQLGEWTILVFGSQAAR